MTLRICVVIPTYNNPLSIAQVVRECLNHTPHPIYIFDDGSDQPVEELISAHPRVKIFRESKNMGKGATLSRAIPLLAAEGFTHMLSLDGDGQHLPSQCQKLTAAAKEHPWDLIIGSRNFESAGDVPAISQFGRKFSNYWVHYQTDLKISDSQSGLRLYPIFHIQMMKFWTKRFDFEIEILIRLIWRNVKIREVRVEVYYPPQTERVSHFDKLWDNVRISLLNAVLVIMSLVRSHLTPQEGALSVGLGVFIGCTPFFGFHTLIVGTFSFLFRLNAVWMLLGSQISMPLLTPFVIFTSTWIGHHLLTISNSFAAWLAGSLILGLFLGIFFGAITFISISSTRRTKKAWTGRTRGGRFGNAFMKAVLKFLGLRWAYACLVFIVPYFYFFAPTARRATNEYWRVVTPESSWARRQLMCLKQFWIYAQILLDRVYFSYSKKQIFETCSEGWERITELRNHKKSALLLTNHMGGWDLSASLIDRGNPENRLYVVKYTAQGLTFDHVSGAAASENILSSNLEMQPVLRIRELLQSGHLVGLMSDRPLSSRFEMVPMFGKLAIFDTTPFHIAALCGVPIVPTYGFKANKNIYDFYALESHRPVYNSQSDRLLQIFEWQKEYVRNTEKMIRRYPTQWFNFFCFWSSVPAIAYTSRAEQNYLVEELHKLTTSEVEKAPGL